MDNIDREQKKEQLEWNTKNWNTAVCDDCSDVFWIIFVIFSVKEMRLGALTKHQNFKKADQQVGKKFLMLQTKVSLIQKMVEELQVRNKRRLEM